MWKNFIIETEKLSLTTRKQEKKIEDIYAWLKRSISPSLYVVFKAAFGDFEVLEQLIKEGGKRISKKTYIYVK